MSYEEHGCRVYWGHCGCDLYRGHDGAHVGLHFKDTDDGVEVAAAHVATHSYPHLFGEDAHLEPTHGGAAPASASRHDTTHDADDIMDAIAAALKARDLQAASDLLHLLALTDPGAAQVIHDWITDVTTA